MKKHKGLKGLKTENLRDHMSEAELIFTALAELSTRQISESEKAKGLIETEYRENYSSNLKSSKNLVV